MADYEQELIQGFLNGESGAYNTITTWITTVLNLRGWHGSIHEARDDIRQEALIALTENFRNNKYKGLGLKTYVSSVTKFLCLKAYDRNPMDTLEGREIPDDNPPKLETMVRHEEFKVVGDALLQINDRCRQMLALRFHKQLDHSEIAKTLEITVATSRQWLKRCLDKLRELVKKDFSM